MDTTDVDPAIASILPDDEELEVANRLAEHRADPSTSLTREEAREHLKALRALRSLEA